MAFYEERQTGLGLDLQRAVLYAVSLIQDRPGGWPTHKHGLRKYLPRRFPFQIFYLHASELVWIVAVAHCSRKPDYWRTRLRDEAAER